MVKEHSIRSTTRHGTLILIGFCLCIAGCGRTINRTAERRIREALPDLLGSARQYRVHVEGDALHTIQGRSKRVIIDADDLQLTDGLLMDRLHLDLHGVDYDTDHRQLRHIDSAEFQATVGENSLDEFLAGESPAGETLRDIRVKLLDRDRVEITALRMTLGLPVPIRMSGPLRLAGPERIEIDPSRLSVIGIPIPDLLLRFLKSHFESAIDLTSLPFPIRLTSVATSPGFLRLSGSADVTALAARGATRVNTP